MSSASPSGSYPQFVLHVHTRARVNAMAVAAFVVSFPVGVLGIVLGNVALRQINRTNEGGRALAIAAVVIGSVGTAAVVGLIALSWLFKIF